MKNVKKYWNESNQQSIIRYYFASTREEKDQIFSNELYQPILNLARHCLHKYSGGVEDDKLQEVLIKISTYTLPNLREDKLNAAFALIWLAMQRQIYSIWQNQIIKPEYYSTSTESISDWKVQVPVKIPMKMKMKLLI